MSQSIGDFAYLAIRLAIAITLILNIGFIYGLLTITLLNNAIYYIAWYGFDMEMMSGLDLIWMYEDKKNPTNIIGSLFIKRGDGDKFLEQLYRKSDQLFRTKSKIVKLFGIYFYKKMSETEYKQKFPQFCVRVGEIHNQKQLSQFMAKEQEMRDPLEIVQFKTIFIDDYSDEESVFIFKCHHCLADGMALITLIIYLSDSFDLSFLPKMRKIPIFQKVLIQIASALYAPYYFIWQISQPNDRNLFHTGKPVKGQKNAAFSKDISVESVKQVAKTMGLTINDLIMGITSSSLKQYLIKNGDYKTKKLHVNVQYSLRETPKTVDNQLLRNNFASLTIPLDLEDDIKAATMIVKKTMDRIKNSLDPFAMYFNVKLTAVAFPSILAKYITWKVVDKSSLVFSNVPGPRTPLYFNGQEAKRLLFFVPGMANLGCGISILSYVDKITVGCLADVSQIPDPDELMNIFNQNFDNLIALENKKKQ